MFWQVEAASGDCCPEYPQNGKATPMIKGLPVGRQSQVVSQRAPKRKITSRHYSDEAQVKRRSINKSK